MEKRTVPPGARGRLFHIRLDGTHESRNSFRLKFRDRFCETPFTRQTCCAPGTRIQIVHWPGAQIDQITPSVSKSVQEILVINGRIHGAKYIPHRAIKSGIAMIEKSAGGRRRFPDKQQPDFSRTKRLPDYLGTRHSSCRMGASLMLAMRRRIRPCSSNSQSSFP